MLRQILCQYTAKRQPAKKRAIGRSTLNYPENVAEKGCTGKYASGSWCAGGGRELFGAPDTPRSPALLIFCVDAHESFCGRFHRLHGSFHGRVHGSFHERPPKVQIVQVAQTPWGTAGCIGVGWNSNIRAKRAPFGPRVFHLLSPPQHPSNLSAAAKQAQSISASCFASAAENDAELRNE